MWEYLLKINLSKRSKKSEIKGHRDRSCQAPHMPRYMSGTLLEKPVRSSRRGKVMFPSYLVERWRFMCGSAEGLSSWGWAQFVSFCWITINKSLISITSLIRTCNTTHSHVGHVIHMHGMTHLYTACVTHRNSLTWMNGITQERRPAYDWVMSHIWMSHVTHINKPCHWIWMSRVTHINDSFHTCEWVRLNISTSRVTRRNQFIWMSHIMHELRPTYDWVMSHVTISHVTYM